jgi:hypothetical protein
MPKLLTGSLANFLITQRSGKKRQSPVNNKKVVAMQKALPLPYLLRKPLSLQI